MSGHRRLHDSVGSGQMLRVVSRYIHCQGFPSISQSDYLGRGFFFSVLNFFFKVEDYDSKKTFGFIKRSYEFVPVACGSGNSL